MNSLIGLGALQLWLLQPPHLYQTDSLTLWTMFMFAWFSLIYSFYVNAVFH